MLLTFSASLLSIKKIHIRSLNNNDKECEMTYECPLRCFLGNKRAAAGSRFNCEGLFFGTEPQLKSGNFFLLQENKIVSK